MFGMVARDNSPVHGARFVLKVKEADDFRRWPFRVDYDYFPTRAEAEERARRLSVILVKRWCDAELTPEEAKASGY